MNRLQILARIRKLAPVTAEHNQFAEDWGVELIDNVPHVTLNLSGNYTILELEALLNDMRRVTAAAEL